MIDLTIIGFGHVGSTLTYHLMNAPGKMRINVMEPDVQKEGAFLDLLHAQSLYPEKELRVNDSDLFSAADFIFHTAGHPNTHGQSRLDKAQENSRLTETIFGGRSWQKDPFVIVITNPVDVITYATLQSTGLHANKVVGTGTFLDSVRLSYYLSTLSGVSVEDIDAYVLGEHGDSQCAIYSMATVSGKPILQHAAFSNRVLAQAMELTRNAAFQIRETQEATIYGVVKCAVELFERLQSRKETRMPLSVLSTQYYTELLGLNTPICLGLPTVVSNREIRVSNVEFENEELTALKQSAVLLSEIVSHSDYR